MSRKSIFAEVEERRVYQEGKWGNVSDDTRMSPWDWVAVIASYSTKWMRGLFAPLPSADTSKFRKAMLDVAAIAVAAVESLDRQRFANGHAFYEETSNLSHPPMTYKE